MAASLMDNLKRSILINLGHGSEGCFSNIVKECLSGI